MLSPQHRRLREHRLLEAEVPRLPLHGPALGLAQGGQGEAQGGALAQELEDVAEQGSISVDENAAILVALQQIVISAGEHHLQHRAGDRRQRGAAGLEESATDIEQHHLFLQIGDATYVRPLLLQFRPLPREGLALPREGCAAAAVLPFEDLPLRREARCGHRQAGLRLVERLLVGLRCQVHGADGLLQGHRHTGLGHRRLGPALGRRAGAGADAGGSGGGAGRRPRRQPWRRAAGDSDARGERRTGRHGAGAGAWGYRRQGRPGGASRGGPDRRHKPGNGRRP
mmetsp:Transcript_55630/g.180530  ORF Transcript_55630/g.180530 Transcript_55630/m.180530 type:complete len:284 (-) Transcript_55630:57-908(-)